MRLAHTPAATALLMGAGALLAASPAAAQLLAVPVSLPAVSVDSLVLGDFDTNNPGLELAVSLNGQNHGEGIASTGGGTVAIYDADLNLLSSYLGAGPELIGGLGVVAGSNGQLPVIFSYSDSADMYAIDATAAQLFWSVSGNPPPPPTSWSYYPGLWGQTPASRSGFGGPFDDDLATVTWGGLFVRFDSLTGQPQASYDAWNDPLVMDNFYGHVAIQYIPGLPGSSHLTAFGYTQGRVVIVDDALNLRYVSNPQLDLASGAGTSAYGSGPAVANLQSQHNCAGTPDGDSNIFVVGSSPSPAVMCFDHHSPDPRWRFDPRAVGYGDEEFFWTSPVLGDVFGDGHERVVVLDSWWATLFVLDPRDGSVELQQTVGDGWGSYFTPSLTDLNGDGVLDVIAASWAQIEGIDVAHGGTVLFSYPSPTPDSTGFWPTAVVADPHGDGNVYAYTSGFADRTLYRITLPDAAAAGPFVTPWQTTFGNRAGTGTPPSAGLEP